MKELTKDLLLQRKEELEALIDRIKTNEGKYPEGRLKICRSKGRTQYYLRSKRNDIKGKYIPASQKTLAVDIAQRDYEQALKKAAEQELKGIKAYLKKMPSSVPEDVYTHLSAGRKELIEPILIPDEIFVSTWEAVSFEKKGFPEDFPDYYTAKQERVRSKSEILIADSLSRLEIPYRYEYPLYLGDRLIHPDFMVLDVPRRKEILWEHLGMMDSPEYVENSLSRIAEYERNGYMIGQNLILTWETSRIPLSTLRIKDTIYRYLL